MPKGTKGFQAGNKEGRKKRKKTIRQEEALEIMRAEIRKRMFGEDGLLTKKFELAEGVYIIKPVKDKYGKVVATKVYEEKPDSQSLEYLFSIVVGKPKESMDITTKGERIYGWKVYAKNNNILPEKVDPTAPRKSSKVEGGSGSPPGGKDNSNA